MERRQKRMLERRKQIIILASIISILLIAIGIVVTRIVAEQKTKQASASQNTITDSNIMNSSDEIEVILNEENVAENIAEENIVEENQKNEEKQNESNENKKNTRGTRYRLEVNCEKNVVNVYEKDSNGEYTNCVKVMLCSIGSATPRSGTYSLKKYGGWEWKGLQGDVYGQYATQITGNILFHSVPYTEKYNPASLEYWEYDKLGTAASLGCIRLTVKNAKWIYDNCASGTAVKFYSDSNPGPLGKPSERKISGEEAYRGWDPTDPSSENPWRNYGKEEKPEQKPEEKPEEKPENTEKPKNEIQNNEVANNEIQNNEIQNNEATNNEAENSQTDDGKTENKENNNTENANKEKKIL